MADDKKRDDYTVEMGERNGNNFQRPISPPRHNTAPSVSMANNPILPVLSYCVSSILMTVTNKFVLSGTGFNLNFFLLCVQVRQPVWCWGARRALTFGTFSPLSVWLLFRCASLRESSPIEILIRMRRGNVCAGFDLAGGLTILIYRAGFPVSLLLIGTIYTSTKALQYLSIPVYTIFKNLTIILIAYGEVLWFGGSVTGMALFSFGLMVLSSVIAAWADIQHALQNYGHASDEASAKVSTLNSGYMWMMLNCVCSAAYVLGMRKRIKLTNFKDFDSMYLQLRLL